MPDGRKEEYVPSKRHQERHQDVREQAKRLHSKLYKIQAVKHHDALQGPTKQDEHHVALEGRRPKCFEAEEEVQGKHSPALTSNVSGCKRGAEVVSSSSAAGKDSTSGSVRELTFYPAYAHRASPTYFSWVKLTIHDIHHKLQYKEEYLHCWTAWYSYVRDTPLLLFYSNHPIQFVQVIGVVVSFDEYYEKMWLFTVDDGSGATIDVVCRKPSSDQRGALLAEDHHDDEKELQKEAERLSEQVKAMVKIGAVLQIKGTITLFQRARPFDTISAPGLVGPKARNSAAFPEATRQLSLQRLVEVCDTAHEISLMAARNEVYDTVLNKPWNLTEREQNRLHREALGEVERQRKKICRRSELQQKKQDEENIDAANIQDEYDQEEQQRALEAERARVAGQNLMQSILQSQNERHTQHQQRLRANAISNAIGKKAKRNKRRPQNTSAQGQHEALGTAKPPGSGNMSFAADDEERAALLHAAFG